MISFTGSAAFFLWMEYGWNGKGDRGEGNIPEGILWMAGRQSFPLFIRHAVVSEAVCYGPDAVRQACFYRIGDLLDMRT